MVAVKKVKVSGRGAIAAAMDTMNGQIQQPSEIYGKIWFITTPAMIPIVNIGKTMPPTKPDCMETPSNSMRKNPDASNKSLSSCGFNTAPYLIMLPITRSPLPTVNGSYLK